MDSRRVAATGKSGPRTTNSTSSPAARLSPIGAKSRRRSKASTSNCWPARRTSSRRQAVLQSDGNAIHRQSNTRAGPIPSAALVVASPSATPPTTMALSAKRAPKRSRRSNCPLWRRPRGGRGRRLTCWRTALSPRRFSTIWRQARPPEVFFRKNMAEPRNASFVANTKSSIAIVNSSAMCDYVAAALLRKRRSETKVLARTGLTICEWSVSISLCEVLVSVRNQN